MDTEMLASLSLLYNPSRWYRSIDESVRLERTVLHREINATIEIPSSGFGSSFIESLSQGDGHFDSILVPVLAPTKGELVDLDEPEVVGPDASTNARFVSHNEHVAYTTQLVRQRVFTVYLTHILTTTGSLSPDDVTRVNRIAHEMVEIALARTEEEGKERLEAAFDAESHHLRDYDGDRPQDEFRLRLLVTFLTGRYLKLARVTNVRPGEIVHLRWTQREHLAQVPSDAPTRTRRWRQLIARTATFLRNVFGTTPSQLVIQTRTARRSDHFVFRMSAPEGYFFHRPTLADSKRLPIPDIRKTPKEGSPAVAIRESGGAHVAAFLRGGPHLANSPRFVTSCFELPPGSTGFAIASGLMTSLVMVLMIVAVTQYDLNSRFDTAALIVAVLAGAGAFASPMLPRDGLFTAPTLTRLVLVANAALGLTFASTILIHGAPPRTRPWLDLPTGWLQTTWLLLATLLGVLTSTGVLWFRWWRTVRCFRQVQTDGGSTHADNDPRSPIVAPIGDPQRWGARLKRLFGR